MLLRDEKPTGTFHAVRKTLQERFVPFTLLSNIRIVSEMPNSWGFDFDDKGSGKVVTKIWKGEDSLANKLGMQVGWVIDTDMTNVSNKDKTTLHLTLKPVSGFIILFLFVWNSPVF